MPEYKLISFDADDTLWDYTTMMLRGMDAVSMHLINRFGPDDRLTSEAIEAVHDSNKANCDPMTVDWMAMRRETFRLVAAGFGYHLPDELADEMLKVYEEARDVRYEFFADMHDTLVALRKRYKLAYITNGITDPDHIGVKDYFDVIITPSTLNLRKPHPRVFEHAAELAGCTVAEILHVGDNLHSDIGGIKGAGGTAVWFNFKEAVNNSDYLPDMEIKTLTQLLDLVGL